MMANRFGFEHFRASRTGNTAVEFALILPVLILLVLGTMETGMTYFASTLLDHATQQTAREIRTGELQAAAASDEDKSAADLFTDRLCENMQGVISCHEPSRLYSDVRSYVEFSEVDLSPPDTDEVTGVVLTEFDPGARDKVVLVRTYYRWPLLTPYLGSLLSNKTDDDGNLLLTSTVAFRNEPFNLP